MSVLCHLQQLLASMKPLTVNDETRLSIAANVKLTLHKRY